MISEITVFLFTTDVSFRSILIQNTSHSVSRWIIFHLNNAWKIFRAYLLTLSSTYIYLLRFWQEERFRESTIYISCMQKGRPREIYTTCGVKHWLTFVTFISVIFFCFMSCCFSLYYIVSINVISQVIL